MEGQLAENPLAELISEIANAELSGALRLSRERAKAIIYFGEGEPVFATSNLRGHSLREVLKRNGFRDEQLKHVPAPSSDAEAADALSSAGILTQQSLLKARGNQVSDVIRTTLLWIDGNCDFDPRVRIARDARIEGIM